MLRWLLRLGAVDVPVLSLRRRAERRVAARLLAAGRPAAFYLGLFTIVKLLPCR